MLGNEQTHRRGGLTEAQAIRIAANELADPGRPMEHPKKNDGAVTCRYVYDVTATGNVLQ